MPIPSLLVVGCEGFIGSFITKIFIAEGWNVVGCDVVHTPKNSGYEYFRISEKYLQFDNVLSQKRFDFCINAAGSGSVPNSFTNPLEDFEANTRQTAELLDGIRKMNKSCKYLHISSAAVYGNPIRLPIEEEDQLSPLSPYGWNKFLSEKICEEYHKIYGLSVAILRPFSVYGNGLRKQLLWDICSQLSVSDRITLFGDGSETRDFINIIDLGRCIKLILDAGPFQGEAYNVANGEQVSIKTVAVYFEELYGGSKHIDFSGNAKKGDPMNWVADISKIVKMGYIQSVALREGVREYISWFNSSNDK
jgi:dTDP-glucose 4,6-dehydratase/UDP-glucose 4-epimerase